MGFLKDFYENYLTLSLYDALGIDLPINILLLAAAIVLCIACFYVGHKQSTESLILRKLMRSESYGEDNAKTLSELGLAKNKFAAKILSVKSGSIRTVVFLLGEVRQSYEEYIEAERAKKKLSRRERKELDDESNECATGEQKYYIPTDMKDKAKHLFERNNSSPLKTALCCILILAFAFALILLMPMLLDLLVSSKAS